MLIVLELMYAIKHVERFRYVLVLLIYGHSFADHFLLVLDNLVDEVLVCAWTYTFNASQFRHDPGAELFENLGLFSNTRIDRVHSIHDGA